MLIISTSQGSFIVNEKGEITQTNRFPQFSGQWLLVGFRHKGKNAFIPFENGVVPELSFYQNGKCQWQVDDRDHGTRRTWGSEIWSIQKVDQEYLDRLKHNNPLK